MDKYIHYVMNISSFYTYKRYQKIYLVGITGRDYNIYKVSRYGYNSYNKDYTLGWF